MRKISKQQGSQWTDEKGIQVETRRITKLEKVREAHASKIGAMAIKAEAALLDLKFAINEAILMISEELKKESGTAQLDIRGHTFYNFDKSVKVFRQISPMIDYDEGKMQAASAAFNEFVEKRMGDKPELEFLKGMILSAFQTTRGKFDTRKINTLLQQRDNIFVSNDTDFQNAIRMVVEAKVIREERVYDQVYLKNPESKEYDVVNLNLSGT